MKKFTLLLLLFITISTISYSQGCAPPQHIYEFYYHGKKYEFVQQKKDWSQATLCAYERGGYLITIEDKEENDAIVNYLTNEFKDSEGNSIIDGDSHTNHLIWLGASL